MAIQLGAPATIAFSFRLYDERGHDLGPLNLSNPDYAVLELRLRRPGSGGTIVVEDASIIVTDAGLGLAEWTAAIGQLDTAGAWKAQAWAGPWPSRIVGFTVLGPNL
jgi:hypothetical protein